MLCSSGSILHIVFYDVHFDMPGCTSFAVLSAAHWAETISGKYSRDVFHGYFLPLYILQYSKPDKNIRNMACWEPAAGYWRDSGVFFYFFGGVWRRGKPVTLFES
jgi:hypothetical protein